MVDFCRVEALTPGGWVPQHAGIALSDPQRYVDTMADKRGKFARCIELDADLQPTGTVWVNVNVPEDPTALVADPKGGVIPVLPCSLCGEAGHRFEGECLL